MTVRSIVLLRHGEAEYGSAFGSDHSRKLNAAGRKQVVSISQSLKEIQFHPNVIFSSDAKRATETLEIYQDSLSTTVKVTKDRGLYNATEETIFEYLYQLENSISSVIFIGHNPTWSQVSSGMTEAYVSLSPADAVVLEADIDSWAESARVWGLRHLKP